MKKLASMALAISLGAGGSAAMAQAVTGTLSGTIAGVATGTTIGSGTGTLSGDVLTLSYSSTRTLTSPLAVVVDIGGTLTIDFSVPSGTFTATTCTPVSGPDICASIPIGVPDSFATIVGDSSSFTTTYTSLGATETNSWAVAAVPEPPAPTPSDPTSVPTLPLAGLGLLIAGMLGLGGRRLRK